MTKHKRMKAINRAKRIRKQTNIERHRNLNKNKLGYVAKSPNPLKPSGSAVVLSKEELLAQRQPIPEQDAPEVADEDEE